jgi:hypothetical protein
MGVGGGGRGVQQPAHVANYELVLTLGTGDANVATVSCLYHKPRIDGSNCVANVYHSLAFVTGTGERGRFVGSMHVTK